MKKEILLARIQELTKAVNQSNENYQQTKLSLESIANNHNMLVGRLAEANEIYSEMEKSSSPLTKVEKEKQKS
jgi:hypothetical protein